MFNELLEKFENCEKDENGLYKFELKGHEVRTIRTALAMWKGIDDVLDRELQLNNR